MLFDSDVLNLTKFRMVYDSIIWAYDRKIEIAQRRHHGLPEALEKKATYQKKFHQLLVKCFGLESETDNSLTKR